MYMFVFEQTSVQYSLIQINSKEQQQLLTDTVGYTTAKTIHA